MSSEASPTLGEQARDEANRERGRDASSMERVTLRITRGQESAVEQAVEEGRYPNRSEAIRDALNEKFVEEEGR